MRVTAIASALVVVTILATSPARAQCSEPPMPAPGQTVTWLRAASPYEVCSTLVLPATGVVECEPGVTVRFRSGAQLVVDGTLRIDGTVADPATLAGVAVWPPILVVGGTLEATHVSVRGQIRPASGGTLVFDSATFSGMGMVFAPDSHLGWIPPFLRFDRCRFEGAASALIAWHCTLVMRDCAFQDTGLQTAYSYPWLDAVVVEGAPGHGLSVTHDYQPLLIDNVQARNCAGAGIQVSGAQDGNDLCLGPRNVIEGNQWPVVVGDGGLVPGSVVPDAGNVVDAVLVRPETFPRGPMTLPRVATRYVVDTPISLGHGLTVEPGVEIAFGPGAGLMAQGGGLRVRGRASDPIRLVPLDPARRWGHFGAQGGDSKLEHCLVLGSENGVASAGTVVHVESSTLERNGWGVQASGYNPIRVRGSRFIDNDIGAITDVLPNSPAFLDLNGETNPNTFLGNGIAVQGGDGLEDARHNWWGTPTGPAAPTNPGGTGDPIGPEVLYQPFRTIAPDATDVPPFVELAGVHFLAEPGSRQILHWTVDEDRAIASQRVVVARAGEYAFDIVVADNLPPDQRSLAWTVPEIGYQPTCLPAYVRVIATDDAGQEGWDQAEVSIRSPDWIPQVSVTTPLSGTFRPGDQIEVCFETLPPEPWLAGLPYAFLLLDGDRRAIPLGGPATSTGCVPLGLTMPYVSTDSARVGVRISEGCNRVAWAFSDCFAIRPDPRVPDAPPVLAVTSPLPGQSFSAGATVPIRWTASDDEGVRSFDVLASTDAGRTWHELATDLPPAATGFDWDLPPGEEYPDVRVLVMVRDLRFQDTSNACGTPIAVVADCLADADGDGVIACDDCAPLDSDAWAPPGEDEMLLFSSKVDFAWQLPASPGARVLLHDVLRTRDPADFAAGAACLMASGPDAAFADAELPGVGRPFFYLVRARNSCGATGLGTTGTDSFGTPRPARDCP